MTNYDNKPPAVTSPPVLLDARTLARMLSISTATVWRLRAAGKLPEPITLTRGTVRWRASEVAAWIEARCPAGDMSDTIPIAAGNQKGARHESGGEHQ